MILQAKILHVDIGGMLGLGGRPSLVALNVIVTLACRPEDEAETAPPDEQFDYSVWFISC
jgi:hypothetical protein